MKFLSVAEVLSDDSVGWVEPSFDSETGTIEYPQIKGVKKSIESPLPKALDRLATRDAIEKEFVDRIVVCRNCASDHFNFHMFCPDCESANIEEISLLKHTDCKCIRRRERFTDGDSHVCPECEATLESLENECEQIGETYYCRECGGRTETPIHHLDCQRCGDAGTPDQTRKVQLYRYRMNESQRESLDVLVSIKTGVTEALEDRKYDVRQYITLTDESDDEHPVDLYATDATFGVEVVVNIHDSVDIDAITALRTAAETNGAFPVLATTSTAQSETGLKLAEQKDVVVLRMDEEGMQAAISEPSENSRSQTGILGLFESAINEDESATEESYW